MKHYILSEQTLRELHQIIGEIPTKFGVLIGNALDRGLREYEPPARERPSDATSEGDKEAS